MKTTNSVPPSIVNDEYFEKVSRISSLYQPTTWRPALPTLKARRGYDQVGDLSFIFWHESQIYLPKAWLAPQRGMNSREEVQLCPFFWKLVKQHLTSMGLHCLFPGLTKVFFLSGSIILYCLLPAGCPAQNPIVPPGVYLADPSARVWQDGRLYVYGSRDESPDYYCSWSQDALSTSDMIHWTLHRNIFASRGEGDEVPYSDKPLYAPDVQYHQGTYYMYYTVADVRHVEGVAVSDSPTGPFRDGRNIELYGYNEIDPAVFIDDDGQAYYLWGQFTAKMAKLKPNMLELDPATVRDSVLTEAEHFFHEGGFLTKRNGVYYFIYAHMGRAGRPTCIAYATSTAPFGPYSYGGVIIDNDHSDPAVWNNHGSIAEYNGCLTFSPCPLQMVPTITAVRLMFTASSP